MIEKLVTPNSPSQDPFHPDDQNKAVQYIKSQLHDRKLGTEWGPDPTFLSVKIMRTMSFEMGTDPCFWGFGAKDVYDRKKKERGCEPVSLLVSQLV